jgi:hypothetical protein
LQLSRWSGASGNLAHGCNFGGVAPYADDLPDRCLRVEVLDRAVEQSGLGRLVERDLVVRAQPDLLRS